MGCGKERAHALKQMATNKQLETIATRLFPRLNPVNVVAKTNLFLARVMSAGNCAETNLVLEHFGRDSLRAVLSAPPEKMFDRESWGFWHAVFGLEPATMSAGFFTVYPWFKGRATEKRQITADMLSHLPGYNDTPVYSDDELQAA